MRQEKRRHLIGYGTLLRGGGTISFSPGPRSCNFFQQNLLHILHWICITRSHFLSHYRLILMIPAQNILNYFVISIQIALLWYMISQAPCKIEDELIELKGTIRRYFFLDVSPHQM